jgi:hypothetical protein
MTTQQLLDQVRAAISALLTGGASSYSIGSRTVTKHNIKELYELEKDLAIRVTRETGSGAFSLGNIVRNG